MRNMKFQFKDSKAISSLKTRAKMSDNNIFSWGGGGRDKGRVVLLEES